MEEGIFGDQCLMLPSDVDPGGGNLLRFAPMVFPKSDYPLEVIGAKQRVRKQGVTIFVFTIAT